MGKIRARTEDELAARKNEILKAAEELLMKESYAAITLATIAEKTSISRTSMYTYYETKEQVMVDLMIREYQAMAGELLSSRTKRMNREAFCAWLSELLWNHQTLLSCCPFSCRYGTATTVTRCWSISFNALPRI